MRILFNILSLWSIFTISRLVYADASVECLSRVLNFDTQCSSSDIDRVFIRSELGVGEDSDFEAADALIVEVKGKNVGGDLDKVSIISQKPIEGNARSILSRNPDNSPLLIAPSAVNPHLKQKDTIVIVRPDSGVPKLSIDSSASVAGQNAGRVVVVADALSELKVTSNGYNGANGESASSMIAKAALGEVGLIDIPSNLSDAYITDRTSNPSKSLEFLSSDLNNYEASGLKCRSDEIAISTKENDYAWLKTVAEGKDPYSDVVLPKSIEITAIGREQSKRTLCKRLPEYSTLQECESEKEYSYRAVCRIKPEEREVRVYKRNTVRWERPVCAASTDTVTRKSVVRTATINIATGDGKVYAGQIQRVIPYAEMYKIYKKQGTPTAIWINPFIEQDEGITDPNIKISNAISGHTVLNNHSSTHADYPEDKGARLTYRLRKTQSLATSVTMFENSGTSAKTSLAGSGAGAYSDILANNGTNVVSIPSNHKNKDKDYCMPIFHSSDYSNIVSAYTKNATHNSDHFNKVLVASIGFDIKGINWSSNDLYKAYTQGVIEVSNCTSYEVIEEISGGTVVYGNWTAVSNNSDYSDKNSSTPASCSGVVGYPNQVGSQSFIQFEKSNACYVKNPTSPPSWLVTSICKREKGGGANCNEGGSDFNDYSERHIPLADLSSEDWNRTTDEASPVSNVDFIYPDGSSHLQDRDDNFCVEMGAFDSSLKNINTLVEANLSIAVKTSSFSINPMLEKAIPAGQRKTCPTGIRLDRFKAMISRPSCPQDTTSGLFTSRFSRNYNDPIWVKYGETDHEGEIEGNYTPTGGLDKYTYFYSFLEKRYDDLPANIYTNWTHEAHRSVNISSEDSYTGVEFPPAYTPKTNGERGFDGWLREKSLVINATGAIIHPNDFAPYKGASAKERGDNWCSAPAYELLDKDGVKVVAQGYGAQGIMRDTARRYFSFTLQRNENASDVQNYTGIEIFDGRGSLDGFSGLNLWPEGNDIGAINAMTDNTAFRASAYPLLTPRYRETCADGQQYNEFGGYCHLVGDPSSPVSRAVLRSVLNNDGTTSLVRWNIPYVKSMFHQIGGFDRAFNKTYNEANLVALTSGSPSTQVGYLQYGLFRPMSLMTKASDSTFINRPELTTTPVMSTGWVTGLPWQSNTLNRYLCSNQMSKFRMIAVPNASNGSKSMVIDYNGYLPDKSLLIAIDVACRPNDNAIDIRATAIEFKASDKSVSTNVGATVEVNYAQFITELDNTISLIIRNSGNNEVYRLKNIKEFVLSGMAATTGREKLEVVEIQQPRVRDRGAEWVKEGRSFAGSSFKKKLKTHTTTPSTNQNEEAPLCLVSNLQGGIWAGEDTNSEALNDEEMGLFTIPVTNSRLLQITQNEVVQYTPWSHELASNIAQHPSYSSNAPFGSWTQIDASVNSAPVPDCNSVFGSATPQNLLLNRSSVEGLVTAGLAKQGTNNGTVDFSAYYMISRPKDQPSDPDSVFMVVPYADDLRRSKGCLRWDTNVGRECKEFNPTIGGIEVNQLVFGGEWINLTVETRERAGQDCHDFKNDLKTCDVAPVANAGSHTDQCTPTSCDFPINTQSFQVEAPIVVTGAKGEDGTDSSGATIFCRNCENIVYEAAAGRGGVGSAPISSSRSKTLTCVRWNQNPLNPQMEVRNLWSQPFVAGSKGANGRAGQYKGGLEVYKDMTPEAIQILGEPKFWIGK